MSYSFENIHVQPIDSNHIANTLSGVPREYHDNLLDYYENKYSESRQGANLYMLDVQGYTQDKSFLIHDEDSLVLKADRLSREANLLMSSGGLVSGIEFARANGVDEPKKRNKTSKRKRLVCELWWKSQLLTK